MCENSETRKSTVYKTVSYKNFVIYYCTHVDFLLTFTLNFNVSHINIANFSFCLHFPVLYICIPLLSNSVLF